VAVLVDLESGLFGSADEAAEDEEGEAALNQAEIDARVARLTQLVRDTIGFNEARGDSVSVINEQFLSPEPLPEVSTPIWEQAWFMSTLKQLGAGIVVLLLVLGVLRPAMKSIVVQQAPARQLAVAGGELGEEQVALSEAAQEQLVASPAPSAYDSNLNRAQALVSQEPQRAARMIQNWMANE
jgi:flagellar M-ring protein FliF